MAPTMSELTPANYIGIVIESARIIDDHIVIGLIPRDWMSREANYILKLLLFTKLIGYWSITDVTKFLCLVWIGFRPYTVMWANHILVKMNIILKEYVRIFNSLKLLSKL